MTAAVVAEARRWIGTPYVDQQTVRGAGCDCLGLVRGVWRAVVGPEPTEVPPYTRDWGETGPVEVMMAGALEWMVQVPLPEAGAGAVVLFRMRSGAIAKHCGILTGEGTMVHARERLGVIEEPYSDSWQRRAVAAFQFPQEG